MKKKMHELMRKAGRFRNALESASYETAKDVSLAVERDELHNGYKRTHCMGGDVS
jgi:hypothetical protein